MMLEISRKRYTAIEATELLKRCTVKELREIAKKNNNNKLGGYAYMRKDEIICALLSNVYGKEVFSLS